MFYAKNRNVQFIICCAVIIHWYHFLICDVFFFFYPIFLRKENLRGTLYFTSVVNLSVDLHILDRFLHEHLPIC